MNIKKFNEMKNNEWWFAIDDDQHDYFLQSQPLEFTEIEFYEIKKVMGNRFSYQKHAILKKSEFRSRSGYNSTSKNDGYILIKYKSDLVAILNKYEDNWFIAWIPGEYCTAVDNNYHEDDIFKCDDFTGLIELLKSISKNLNETINEGRTIRNVSNFTDVDLENINDLFLKYADDYNMVEMVEMTDDDGRYKTLDTSKLDYIQYSIQSYKNVAINISCPYSDDTIEENYKKIIDVLKNDFSRRLSVFNMSIFFINGELSYEELHNIDLPFLSRFMINITIVKN